MPRLGAGREADVYVRDETTVLKLYRLGFGGHHTEAATLRSLHALGVAPKLLDVVELEGRIGLVMERIAGPDMLAALQRKPWKIRDFGRSLATVHLAVHRVQAPAGLRNLREVLADRIADAKLPQHLNGFVSRVLDLLPDGGQLCHGDFHPGNVLVEAGRARIIDWGSATRGTPEADHARTLLLLRWGDPPPGTPLLSRALIAGGRSALAATYAHRYRRDSPPLRHTGSWLAVHAAARLSEGIESEREMLLGRLERALRTHRPE
jgi:Ser/Thr protein kinase RdoA (MazF antagonist)